MINLYLNELRMRKLEEKARLNIDKEPDYKIPLNEFGFSTSEKNGSKGRSFFLGREKQLRRLKDRLQKNKRSSILVAGYRGVGKTRFVEEAVNKEDNQLEIRINLGSDNKIDSRTVLFNMISLFANGIEEKLNEKIFYKFIGKILSSNKSKFFIIGCFFVLVFLVDFIPKFQNTTTDFISLISYYIPVDLSSLISNVLAYIVIALFIVVMGTGFLNIVLHFYSLHRHLRDIQRLREEIYSTSEETFKIGNELAGLGKRIVNKPLDNNQIEGRLCSILKKITKKNKVIFIFDELDKLSGGTTDNGLENLDLIKESKLRKKQVDAILGDLKNLITASEAIYIFIAGRDMYDAYLSERGSTNSLYESLFNDHIYIPSLLTDHSDEQIYLLDSMIEAFIVSHIHPKKDLDHKSLKISTYIQYCRDNPCSKSIDLERDSSVDERHLVKRNYYLKILTHFLTLHSWGNYKRLITLFESFVELDEDKQIYYLSFKSIDIQRLILASNLYIMFHHNLSRILMNSDDKLVVSSFSLFHHILKYHGFGFSRENILRMYETINIHSSPELTTIVDIILYNVLRNHIRRIRNGLYRYRFGFVHEKEIHFITNINDDESAAFSFSLNTMDSVKQHFRNLIASSHYSHTDERYGNVALASIHVIVGNFHFWEQSYDEASIHYGIAADMLDKESVSKSNIDKISTILQLVEVYLKQGSVAERVGNYSKASSTYINAEIKAEECLKIAFSTGVKNHDSKWDVLRQPKWARKYLNLKRSGIHYLQDISNQASSAGTDVTKYREGVLSLFLENPSASYNSFVEVARAVDHASERSYFLLGNAYLKAAFSKLLIKSNELYKNISEIRVSSKEGKNSDDAIGKVLNIVLDYIIESIENISDLDNINLHEFEEIVKSKHISRNFSESDNYKNEMFVTLGLMKLSAACFSQGRLNLNAAVSQLSMVMMWSALLEIFPWNRIKSLSFLKIAEFQKKIKDTQEKINKIRKSTDSNFIFSAQEQALKHIGYNTGKAFSHFMKTSLMRNLGKKELVSPFNHEKNLRKMFLDPSFLTQPMFQHYSVFGQMGIASVYWEEMVVKNACQIKENELDAGLLLVEGDLLPYSVRYYSTMLWLRGREYLNRVLDADFDNCNIIIDDRESVSKEPDEYEKSRQLIEYSMNAIVNLFRSSQYVAKTYGESSGMSLPPLFIIYYNMWEVLFRLVSICRECHKDDTYEGTVFNIRKILSSKIDSNNVMDVSSRVLDLAHVETLALEQLRVVERMGDLNSKDRTNILRNKYFIDDDFEDNMFNLDWFYCRFLAPGAMIYRMIIKNEMTLLRKE